MNSRAARLATAALAAALTATATQPATAQGTVPTPEATEFTIAEDTADQVSFGFALKLGEDTSHLVGLVASCAHAEGRLRVLMFFGAFPTGKPVQIAARTADGDTRWFGRPLFAPATGKNYGFHDPILEDTEARDFVEMALKTGTLVSNGHNSWWNRIPGDANRQAIARLDACTETAS